ncbi:armadillo repeat-containing protein 5 [Phymastichus coffea]|uniref:armadillo repeat-containing protein 5 n=1 Tax=Phymastichus coffea TaxID=108790 RepID=UPI00273B8985|nr:armadillo repeat-containing protein 5 [Phymastichus coffea]
MSTDLEKADSRTLLELKKHIKADSKVHIHSCLTRVKENQQCCKRFIKAGGLKFLVQLLRYQDQKVINAALSILANVCLNSDVRQQVQDTNIVSYTLWILNNLEVGDTLHCRACRLIGNLSDCISYAKAFYNAGAIQSLNYVLRTKANQQTYTMAIRAIRNIWSIYDGSHRKVIESGVIKSITSIFISAGKKTESKYTDLSEACMKAFLAFLNSCSNECANQMIGEKQEGFKTLMKFYEAQNKLAIKCIYCLTAIPECRPLLGDCDVVEATVLLVQGCSFYLKEIIACLCLFCREAVNRIRIRYCYGLQVILDLLRKEDHERYHPLLLHGLAQFICDDESILIMVKNGLLDVLTNKLQKMSIELPDDADEKATPKKRTADRSPYRKGDLKYNRTHLGRFSSDYPQDNLSPRSRRSDLLTPPSTPPMKLLGGDEDTDDVAEENYSPVCSDNEWSDQEPQEEVESLKSFSSATVEVEEAQEKVSKTELNKHINAWTLVLLSKLSYSDDPIDRLADPATIGPLATYVRLAKNPKASRILVRIVKNKAYLMPLIKQGFVFEVQNLSGHEQYTRQLCALAETGGAVGELASILLRGQETHRSVIALSIPFLIKSKDLLRQLLNTYGGLPLIFDALSDSEHSLHKEAIWSICQLADSLDVRPEGIDKNQSSENGFIYHDTSLHGVENYVKPSTVTFELDDGSTVDACRRLLCQRSDAFSAMLEGNFSESGKRCVKLRNTSREGLNTLLLAANGSDFNHRTIESLLDAVVLADKFLMADISELLTESSISKLNYENCCRAWSWARTNQCSELRLCCVKSFLTTNMTRAERIRAFNEFSTSENFKEFLDEILEIISGVLLRR